MDRKIIFEKVYSKPVSLHLNEIRVARLQNTPQLKLFGAATENGYAVGASTRYSKGLGMSYLYSADKSSNYFKVF